MYPLYIREYAAGLLKENVRRYTRFRKYTPQFNNFINFCNTSGVDIEKIYGKIPFLEILFCVTKDVGPALCRCGNILKSSRLGTKYCSIKCRSADKHYCRSISNRKFKLYSDPKWKDKTEKKKVETTLKNYGVRYPMQDITLFKKQQASCFKKDENGLHGYEPLAYPFLKQLYSDLTLGTSFLEEHSIEIKWTGDDGKSHRSYPDFFTETNNLFIEIKSDYTRKLHNAKLVSCYKRLNEMGYGYVIVVVIPNKTFLIETFNLDYIT